MANGRNKLENRVDWRTIQVQPLESTVKQVPATSIWPCEEYNFTPWLAEHIEEIDKLIGTDLSIIATEQRVGRYEVDIFADDLASGEKFIIENQFGQSDNTHVGKISIYADNLDAKGRIWIGEKMLPEHIRHFEKQNKQSENSYYGIEVKAFEINGKRFYEFEVVVRPDDPLVQLNKVMAMSESACKTYNMVQDFYRKFAEEVNFSEDKIITLSTDGSDREIKVLQFPGKLHHFMKVYKRDKKVGFSITTKRRHLHEEAIDKFLAENNIDWLEKQEGVKNNEWVSWRIFESYEDAADEKLDWAVKTCEKMIKLFSNFVYNN